MLKKIFYHLLYPLTSLFLPDKCIQCSKYLAHDEYYICNSCLKTLPLHQNRKHTSFSLYNYQNPVKLLIKKLKYGMRPEIGEILGKQLGTILQSFHFIKSSEVILIPVPLHRKRKRERGYNQSYHIALGMSEILKVDVSDSFVIRIENNVTQTSLSREERFNNVKNIFTLQGEYDKEMSFIIVDDLVTTGATTREITRLLERNGYNNHLVVSVAAPVERDIIDDYTDY